MSPLDISSVQFSSFAQSCPTLWPHELQHTRSHSPSPTPRVYSNSSPLSLWCYATISSSVVPFSSHLQSSQHQDLFKWVSSFHQVTKVSVSASTSVLPMNIQDWYPLGWTGWISSQSKGLKSLLQHHSSKPSILHCSGFFIVQLSYLYMTTGKTIALARRTFVGKVMSLLFKSCLGWS